MSWSCLIRSSVAVVVMLLAFAAAGGRAWAENEGQEELDQATEGKLTANTLTDLADVIRLCESALQKGLDEDNAQFATNLLASTLIQRGSAVAATIFHTSPPDHRWPQFRHVALTDLEKGLKLSPKHPQALLLIARLNLLPGGDAKRAAKALDGAIELLEEEPAMRAKALMLRSGLEKDLEKKLAGLNEAVRLAPTDAAAVRARALVLADSGKPEQALADLDKALELAPKHMPTYAAKALVLARLNNYDQALATLEEARQLKPNSVFPLIQKARILAQKKDTQAALAELDGALAIDPGNVAVLLLRAALYEEMDQREKALADVDQVLRLKPGLPAAMRVRAMLLAGAGKFEQAIAEMEKLHKLVPKDTLAMLQLAMFYSAEKKLDQAIETYSAVLAEEPENWIALRGRGDSLLNLGKHTEALVDYEKAIKLKPKDPGVLNNLAWLLATSPTEEVRNGKRAVTLATEACEQTDYKQAHILSTLAAAYAETGNFESAIKWTEKGLEAADEEQKEPLSKELESYRAGKPWRELLP